MALVMLHVSPDDDDVVSADDETVAMDVNDSDDGSEALSENAESVSPASLICSPSTVRQDSTRMTETGQQADKQTQA